MVCFFVADGCLFSLCSEPLRDVSFYATALKQNYCKELGKAEREKKRGGRGWPASASALWRERRKLRARRARRGGENRKRRMWVKANRCAGRQTCSWTTFYDTADTTDDLEVTGGSSFEVQVDHSCDFLRVAGRETKFAVGSLTENNQSG